MKAIRHTCKSAVLIGSIFAAFFLLAGPHAKTGSSMTPVSRHVALSSMAEDLAGSASQTVKPRVAVAAFRVSSGKELLICSAWAESLSHELAKTGKVKVISPGVLNRVLAELGLNPADMADPPAVKKAGKATKADWIVTGDISVKAEQVEITARARSTEDGAVVASSKAGVSKKEVAGLLKPAAQEGEKERAFPESREELEVRLSFVAGTDSGGAKQMISIQPGTVLHSGDLIKVLFKADRECYVYILQYGSSGEAGILFPVPEIALTNPAKKGKDYAIPPGNDWYYLDDVTGRESLYFIASVEPIKEMDKLLARLEKAGKGKDDDKLKHELTKEFDDIFRQRGVADSDKPIDITGTAGFRERNIGGVTEGPQLKVPSADGTERVRSTKIVGKGIVGRNIVFEHKH